MDSKELKDKKLLILGMGVSGRSAASFLMAQQAILYAVDKNAESLKEHPEIVEMMKKGLLFFSEDEAPAVDAFAKLILSPGIPKTHPLVKKALEAGIPVIGEIELGALFSCHPLVGITGTNGKTTVTLLVTHLLNEAGKKASSLGNTGRPLTKELLDLPFSTEIILELSSYQLESLSQKVLDQAVILNITPDHLDRYPSMEEYAQAKIGIENNLKAQGSLYLFEEVWKEYSDRFFRGKPRLFGYDPLSYISTDLKSLYREGVKITDLPPDLVGKKSHSLENFLAAFALATERGLSPKQILSGWKSFKKPRHRIEFVKKIKGVSYYDDSKGTNVDAVIRAVESLNGKIILIAGGVDKGSSYLPWVKPFKDKVKSICLIGDAADKIRSQLSLYFIIRQFSTLKEAVAFAAKEADEGDNVLLSPGCASFDMFRDYAHRGEEFQRFVHDLCSFEEIK